MKRTLILLSDGFSALHADLTFLLCILFYIKKNYYHWKEGS
jgi:hypothetical protein